MKEKFGISKNTPTEYLLDSLTTAQHASDNHHQLKTVDDAVDVLTSERCVKQTNPNTLPRSQTDAMRFRGRDSSLYD